MSDKLDKILKDLQKIDDGVMFLSDEDSPCVVNEWVSTGCLALDAILGSGLPVGRLTEIYGDTATGKSLLAAQAVATAQEEGHIAMVVDTESAVSLPIMEAVGVDIDRLIYKAPDTVEEVFELFDEAIQSKNKHDPDALLLLVWDSIAATSVVQEMEAEYGKATMGRHAALISQALRKLTRKVSKSRVCVLFLNQTRQKIGIIFGDNETTFGGKAVSFYSSARVRLKLGRKIKENKRIIGIETRATVVKNKVAHPFKEATLPIYFGEGVDDAEAALLYLKENGGLDLQGAWYTISINGEEKKFQRRQWYDIFDEHYDVIADMVLGEFE